MKKKELEIAITTYTVAYKKGCTQRQEDNKDKKYTIEDVINIVDNVSKNWFRCYSHNDKKEHILKIIKQD